MSHIFISYTTKDGSDIAHQLVAALETIGLECWIMSRDMTAGIDFPEQIVTAIEGSRGMVVVLTPGANQSRDVLQEVHNAHNAGKLIVPLIVDGTQLSKGLTYFLSVPQHIAWTEANTVAAAIGDVLTTVGAGRTYRRPAVPQPRRPDTALNPEIQARVTAIHRDYDLKTEEARVTDIYRRLEFLHSIRGWLVRIVLIAVLWALCAGTYYVFLTDAYHDGHHYIDYDSPLLQVGYWLDMSIGHLHYVL